MKRLYIVYFGCHYDQQNDVELSVKYAFVIMN